MDKAKKISVRPRLTTQEVVFIGLSVALMTVSAWISIPFVLVPFTLQTLVMVFLLLALQPRVCMMAVVAYLFLGAFGVPVFSSMRGGIGILLGPSGGFLWGFLIGAVGGLVVLNMAPISDALRGKKHRLMSELPAALMFLLISYGCGWVQLCAVTSLPPDAAFISGVAPFLVAEPFKLVVGVLTARAVRKALPKNFS